MSLVFWRSVFHRWFIEYNPLYLLSACSVLVGVSELSQGLSHSAYSAVAVAGVAELYAWALIGSAAFLMRMRLPRPAVMLALLIAVYQCDPTLHTETCAYLGATGVVAGATWLTSFVAKIAGLAWAMRVRLPRSTLLLTTFGALGVLLIPPYLRQTSAVSMSSLVALWLFALLAFGLWGSHRITSLTALDDWGRTVFSRAVRGIWAIFAVLTLSHTWFWASEFELKSVLIVPVLLLLSTRWMPREWSVWLAVAGSFLIGVLMPQFFATIALMAAVTLALRAFRMPEESGRFAFAERPDQMRLVVGSLSALYFAAWTAHWSGGALPDHVWWCDALLTISLLGLVWRWRAYVALAPLVFSYLQFGIRAGIISLPRTRAQWGLAEVGCGFALLATALLTSWQAKSGVECADAERRSSDYP